jgi:hypothetical protein
MLTVEEIVALAAHAAAGGRNFVFRDLAIAVGIHSRNGWIYLPAGTRPAAHGWQAFAKIMSGERVGWTGRDLLVEMSKASVSPADLAAAEREAHVMLDAPAGSAHGRPDTRGMHLGPGHVAPATIEAARDEALAEGDGRAQQLAWRESILRAVEGPDSAQARRYAKRRLLDKLHEQAFAEDVERMLPLRPSVSEIRAARAAEQVAAHVPEGSVVVGFDRVGRHGTTSLRIDSTDPDEIARQIRKHIRTNRLIASREFDVHVDIEGARVLLDGGRFGRGTIAGLPSRPADELPDCDCIGLTGPDGAHAVACRRGEAIRRRGITTEHDEQAAAYAAALREYHERARRGPADAGRYPFERENRIAAAYTLFADLADSGGPGTARGLRAAVESASTVTETQLVHAARGMIAKLNTIGLSTPVRVNPHTFASILAGELASLGFDVK